MYSKLYYYIFIIYNILILILKSSIYYNIFNFRSDSVIDVNKALTECFIELNNDLWNIGPEVL